MSREAVTAHARAIDACNQRGGRMLTLVDLIEAGTVDLPLAACLAAVMRTGASLLVGAQPGGAGKTTIMCALLNFLPNHTVIRPVESPTSLRLNPQDATPGATCFLAHEIGSGPYYAYIWGETARTFFHLAAQGHTVATNLHADTLEQTRDQLCHQNGVDEAHLTSVGLKLFIGTARAQGWDVHRWVSQVYEGNEPIWRGEPDGTFSRRASSTLVTPEQEEQWADFLSRLREHDTRTIPEIRAALAEFG